MTTIHELIENQVFRARLEEKAHKWFNLEETLGKPTVIFERPFNEFWLAVDSSGNKELAREKITSGEIIPVNGHGLEKISFFHDYFHAILGSSDRNIPTIPTLIQDSEGKLMVAGKYRPEEIPGICVRKISYNNGKILSHRGKGLTIERVDFEDKETFKALLPGNRGEFIQPFIVPPDKFIRDIRVYVVGGQPVAGVFRKASKPLLPENLRGEVLPTQEQYYSAQCRGLNKPLTGELKDRTFEAAAVVAQILEETVAKISEYPSPHCAFGFGSIDFLLDSKGVPLPVDFDLYPEFRDESVERVVAKHFADFLYELSGIDGTKRRIILITITKDRFCESTYKNLEAKTPKREIISQETILRHAIKQDFFTSPEKSSEVWNPFPKKRESSTGIRGKTLFLREAKPLKKHKKHYQK